MSFQFKKTILSILLGGFSTNCSHQWSHESRNPAALSKEVELKELRVMLNNQDALNAKRALIKNANRSVDLAYYIIEGDESTVLLIQDILERKRANPKFEVRILVDYWQSQSQLKFLKFLAQIPGFQIKRYGAPDEEFIQALNKLNIDSTLFLTSLMSSDKDGLMASLQNSQALKLVATLKSGVKSVKAKASPLALAAKLLAAQGEANLYADLGKGLRRFLSWTHFKLTLVDKKCFVMGGRNLSNQYHVERNHSLVAKASYVFNDVDVRGCEARSSSQAASFAGLWNSPRSAPLSHQLIEKVAVPAMTFAEFQELLVKGKNIDSLVMSSDSIEASATTLAVLADNQPPVTESSSHILREYVKRIQEMKAGEELQFVNAYFYVDTSWPPYMDQAKKGKESLISLHDAILQAANRGVKVKVYTNSEVSTDLSMVNFQAFKTYRRLHDAGVKIFELQKGKGSLHQKAAVFGDHHMAVGSFNLDPRSHLYDTNNVLFFGGDAAMKDVIREYQKQVEEIGWTEVDEARLQYIDAVLKVPDQAKQKMFKMVNSIREVL